MTELSSQVRTADVLPRDADALLVGRLAVPGVGPALVVTPLWAQVGRRWGKRRGLVIATLAFAVGAVLALPAVLAHARWGLIPAALAVALVGVGYAGLQVFPMAMLPDVAAVDSLRSGESRIGVYTGLWTAGETLGLALGPFLYAAVLAVGGYRSSTTGPLLQDAEALHAIALGFTVGPALLVLLGLLPLRGYRLDERRAGADLH